MRRFPQNSLKGFAKIRAGKNKRTRTARKAIGMASVLASLMSAVLLWATVVIAGVNEDLINASDRIDLREVKPLLAKGAKVNAKNQFINTLIHS